MKQVYAISSTSSRFMLSACDPAKFSGLELVKLSLFVCCMLVCSADARQLSSQVVFVWWACVYVGEARAVAVDDCCALHCSAGLILDACCLLDSARFDLDMPVIFIMIIMIMVRGVGCSLRLRQRFTLHEWPSNDDSTLIIGVQLRTCLRTMMPTRVWTI